MNNVYLYILIMAVVTYLIRVIPFLVFRREIKNRFVRSFLYYVPYATLAAMTFPSILTATGSVYAGAVALAAALVLSFLDKPMPIVAVIACAGAYLTQLVIGAL